VTEQEAVEILEARGALEAIVARYAAENVTEADVARLRSMMSQLTAYQRAGDILAYADLNAELHAEIARIAKHGTATKLLSGLNSQVVRFQYQSIFQPGRVEHSIAEHRRLIDAIVSKKPAAAEAAMRRHLGNAVLALRKCIKANAKSRTGAGIEPRSPSA
jgi:DNA-binding GntR family transcriptional regulator